MAVFELEASSSLSVILSRQKNRYLNVPLEAGRQRLPSLFYTGEHAKPSPGSGPSLRDPWAS